MSKESIRKKVEEIKRRKLATNKVVNLADFRALAVKPKSQTVLVVDDDSVMRAALKRILEAEGYKTILAKDGIELSKTLETTQLEMVLLDVNLPWVDGYELSTLIKSHHSLKGIPLILISARKTDEDIEKGFAAGADDYITKPFEVDHLIATLNKLLLDKSS